MTVFHARVHATPDTPTGRRRVFMTAHNMPANLARSCFKLEKNRSVVLFFSERVLTYVGGAAFSRLSMRRDARIALRVRIGGSFFPLCGTVYGYHEHTLAGTRSYECLVNDLTLFWSVYRRYRARVAVYADAKYAGERKNYRKKTNETRTARGDNYRFCFRYG